MYGVLRKNCSEVLTVLCGTLYVFMLALTVKLVSTRTAVAYLVSSLGYGSVSTGTNLDHLLSALLPAHYGSLLVLYDTGPIQY